MKLMFHNLLAALARGFGYPIRGMPALSNIAEGTHEDSITKLSDAAITTRNLLVKSGSDGDHVAVCGANDLPLGVCTDEPSAAEREVNVALFGCAKSTRIMVASEPIAALAEVFTAALGKVQDAPATPTGTYYRVGRAIQAASGDGEAFEVDPYPPMAYVVS